MIATGTSTHGHLAATIVATLLIMSGAARAACIDLPPQGEGVVASVEDARTLRLDDGREIRLAGVEVETAHRREAIAALSVRVRGRQVALHGPDDTPDRYGRQPAVVFVEGEPKTLQVGLLEAGQLLVGIGGAPADCRAELLAAETAARDARVGLWASAAALKNAENVEDVLTRAGQFSVIEGRVLLVRETGGTIFLNFGRRWTRDFAVTISRRILGSFEAAGISPKSLENKRIRVRGWVERRSGPQIAVRDVGQIEVPGAH